MRGQYLLNPSNIWSQEPGLYQSIFSQNLKIWDFSFILKLLADSEYAELMYYETIILGLKKEKLTLKLSLKCSKKIIRDFPC